MISSGVTITVQLICITRKCIGIDLFLILYVACSSAKSRTDPEIWKVGSAVLVVKLNALYLQNKVLMCI